MPFSPDRFLAETDPDTGIDKDAFNPDKFLADTAPAPREQGFMEQAGRATVNALPMIGGVAGGILGTPADALTGPAGTAVGAGIGGYLGTAAKNAINHFIDPMNAPRTTGEAVLDPIIGGAEQGLGQASGEAVAAGASKISPVVAEYLNKVAETRAAKALGATKAAFRKYGKDAMRKIGRYGLDEEIVSPLATAEKMADRNAAVGENAMNTRKEIYDTIDAGAASTPSGEYPQTAQPDYSNIDPNEFTPRKINGEPEATDPQLSQMGNAGNVADTANIGAANANAYNPVTQVKPPGFSKYNPLEAAQAMEKSAPGLNPKDPLDAGSLKQLNDMLESVRLKGADNLSMNEAQAVQQKLAREGDWSAGRSNAGNDIAENAAMAHREYLNQAAENAAGDIGGEGLKGTIQKANQQYSQGRTAAKLLNNRTSSELGNKTFGITDTVLAAGAANPMTAAAEVGLKHGLEQFGNQTAAVGADWLKQVIEGAPQSLGKWSPALTQAAARGMNSLAATDYILQQTDPEYREHLKNLKSNPDDQQ